MAGIPYSPTLQADYDTRWAHMVILQAHAAEVTQAAHRILINKARYQEIEKLTGAPWVFVGLCHYRESNLNFYCHLHEGSPLTGRTRGVPAGYPKTHAPPFTWTESAVDALHLKGLTLTAGIVWTFERLCYELERYNGFGYRMKGVTSSYLYAMTSQHVAGKFYADHMYSATVQDQQAGVLGILQVLEKLDPTITFAPKGSAVSPLPPPVVVGGPGAAPAGQPLPKVPPKPKGLSGLLMALVGMVSSFFRKRPA